jgi:hypothetical protein
MPTYTYPDTMALREIERLKMPNLERDRPVFQFFPIEELTTVLLRGSSKTTGLASSKFVV